MFLRGWGFGGGRRERTTMMDDLMGRDHSTLETLSEISLDVRIYTTPSVGSWVLLALERSQHCSSGVLDLFGEL